MFSKVSGLIYRLVKSKLITKFELFGRMDCFVSPAMIIAGKGLTSWFSFVVSNCEFVTFPLVSWVGCGT